MSCGENIISFFILDYVLIYHLLNFHLSFYMYCIMYTVVNPHLVMGLDVHPDHPS
jgi:hypothetical protein